MPDPLAYDIVRFAYPEHGEELRTAQGVKKVCHWMRQSGGRVIPVSDDKAATFLSLQIQQTPSSFQ